MYFASIHFVLIFLTIINQSMKQPFFLSPSSPVYVCCDLPVRLVSSFQNGRWRGLNLKMKFNLKRLSTEVTSELFPQDLCCSFQGCGEVLGKTPLKLMWAFWSCRQISRRVSMIPKSFIFISFQTPRLIIHESQISCNTMFFPNIKITGTNIKYPTNIFWLRFSHDFHWL